MIIQKPLKINFAIQKIFHDERRSKEAAQREQAWGYKFAQKFLEG